jgi:hypothetical protein
MKPDPGRTIEAAVPTVAAVEEAMAVVGAADQVEAAADREDFKF